MANSAETEAQFDRVKQMANSTELEVPHQDEIEPLAITAVTLLKKPPTEIETMTLFMRFIYQLGRNRGRQEGIDYAS